MRMTLKPMRCAGLTAIAAVLVGLGADEATKSYEVGGLAFQAPTAWKSVKPRSSLSQVQLVVKPLEGEPESAVLTLSTFGAGQGGGVEANVRRWQMQFKDDDGNTAKAESKVVKGKNVEVNRVEVGGHYYPPPFLNEKDKPDYRLLGGIVQTDNANYFIKLIGPEKTVAAAAADFDKLLASLKVSGEK